MQGGDDGELLGDDPGLGRWPGHPGSRTDGLAEDEYRQLTPSYFRLEGPLLAAGRVDVPLFATDQLWGHLKIYAKGGENDLHAHPSEDHVFVVLQGQATFIGQDDAETVLAPYDGALLPRGSYYRFRSTGDVNLVMLRVGAGSNSRLEDKQDERVGPDGRPMCDNPVAQGAVAAVEDRRTFGAR